MANEFRPLQEFPCRSEDGHNFDVEGLGIKYFDVEEEIACINQQVTCKECGKVFLRERTFELVPMDNLYKST